jgi:hypothetical protein
MSIILNRPWPITGSLCPIDYEYLLPRGTRASRLMLAKCVRQETLKQFLPVPKLDAGNGLNAKRLTLTVSDPLEWLWLLLLQEFVAWF